MSQQSYIQLENKTDSSQNVVNFEQELDKIQKIISMNSDLTNNLTKIDIKMLEFFIKFNSEIEMIEFERWLINNEQL